MIEWANSQVIIMCKNDSNVSPYLLRRLRSQQEVMRKQAEKARGAIRSESPNGATTGNPARNDGDGECSPVREGWN